MGNKPDKFVSIAIIYDPNSGLVLLQHRERDAHVSPNKWGLFGGHGEEKESPEQTLLRELKEEIGISFQKRDLKFLHDYSITPELRRYVFLVDSLSSDSEIILNEGQGFAWIPLEKVFDYDLTDRVKKDFEKFLQSKIYKNLYA